MSSGTLIFLIAGEPSGDRLGADLIISLKRNQGVRFMGIGGDAMKAEGLESLFPMEELSLMGIFSILRDLPNLLRRLRYTVKTIQEVKPDMVITIDSPDFSFRVMKRLHKLPSRPKLVHYVAPTVWAWRPGRARKIAQFLDHLLCLYPFEPPLFEKYGLKSTFVGHPIARMTFKTPKRDPNLLCVLPGSRRSELKMLLPIFGETISLVKKEIPGLKVIIPTLPALKESIEKQVKTWPVEVSVVEGEDKRNEAFERAYVGLAASGTVALQLAAARLPFVVAYSLGVLSGKIAHILIKIPYVCMVNILLGFEKGVLTSDLLTPRGMTAGSRESNMDPAIKSRDVKVGWIPEYIQENCQADKIARGLLQLFKDEKAREGEIKAMAQAVDLLKAPISEIKISELASK
ncbi:MAG: lipid-A-disaccharide synthase [Alphaproteobacteria bacterium]|nr:lipid-A-disaccharide synthase [Alphaproteobacteria bacterium]